MKYTVLNNTNVDITDDLQKVTDFFKSKGWEITFETKKTNYPIPKITARGKDNGQTQWVVFPDIKVQDKTIFMFNGEDIKVSDGYLTSTTVDKDLISLLYTKNNDNTGWLWTSISHEIMHTLFKELSSRGLPVYDCMDFGQFLIDGKYQPKTYYKNDDPYATDGNYAEAFKRLEPYKTLFMKQTYRYFKDSEIIGLKPELVALLDKARGISGVPFSISSGLRTPVQNELAGGVENSAHLLGKAVDIHCPSSINRLKMVKALLDVGFTRIGIGKDFVHVDIGNSSDNLPENVMWTYYK
ncbi:MAG: D-Ala-D-Ala carboxypeptidase family metallohydrolase [Minisyncoccia bacterium]